MFSLTSSCRWILTSIPIQPSRLHMWVLMMTSDNDNDIDDDVEKILLLKSPSPKVAGFLC